MLVLDPELITLTHTQTKDLYFLDVTSSREEDLFHMKKCFGVVDECFFQFLVEQVNFVVVRTLLGTVVTEALLTQSSTT